MEQLYVGSGHRIQPLKEAPVKVFNLNLLRAGQLQRRYLVIQKVIDNQIFEDPIQINIIFLIFVHLNIYLSVCIITIFLFFASVSLGINKYQTFRLSKYNVCLLPMTFLTSFINKKKMEKYTK